MISTAKGGSHEQQNAKAIIIFLFTFWEAEIRPRLARAENDAPAGGYKTAGPMHLLSGILVCASCGGHYVVRNRNQYQCSSQANGRLCSQKLMLPRLKTDRALLAGVKEQLLAPAVVRDMAKRIRAAARKAPPDDTKARAKKLDRQISALVDTICEVGKSDILTAKLRQLEQQRRALTVSKAEAVPLVAGAADKWREVVWSVENLSEHAKPDETEAARLALREIIGEVSVVEQGARVLAYAKLNTAVVHNSGAEKRT